MGPRISPLAHDFFQILLTLRKFSHEGSPLQERLSIVFDYINRYWRLSPGHLKTVPFDLEKCFALIDLQFREALQEGKQEEANHLRAAPDSRAPIPSRSTTIADRLKTAFPRPSLSLHPLHERAIWSSARSICP